MLILDGGMSRELIRLKAPFKQPEWSALALIEAPKLVRQVHDDFAAAGANILTTNSYALVPFHIGEKRFKSDGEKLANLSGRLAREAADAHSSKVPCRVAASLPPVFGSYEPALFDASRVHDMLAPLVRGLAPHADIWLGETLSLIAEGEAVLKATAQFSKPTWIAFTLDDKDVQEDGNMPRLRSGETVADAAQWALDSKLDALLFNCSKPEVMLAAVVVAKETFTRRSDAQAKIPLIGVYANAFIPQSEGQKANSEISDVRSDLDTTAYMSFARQWVAAGAGIVGGCCGIGNDTIRDMAREFGQN